ncbi:MAG: SDR family NAD(P)-dependent oxidoreductase, partial [Planctomycetota bacterium]
MSDAPEVLVTGAAGFIGAAVCRRLVALGARVVGVDDLSAGDPARVADLAGSSFDLVVADVRDESLLDGLLAREPRAVLHLAGHVGVRRVLADPEQCEAENLALGRSLADAVARCDRVPRLVAAST